MTSEMIETRFEYKPVETVIGWAIVIGVTFGFAGGVFCAWILGVLK